jgi:hypothetical protein
MTKRGEFIQVSMECLGALNRLGDNRSPRAMAERAYWDKNPMSVKYVEPIELRDAIDLTESDGVWRIQK